MKDADVIHSFGKTIDNYQEPIDKSENQIKYDKKEIEECR